VRSYPRQAQVVRGLSGGIVRRSRSGNNEEGCPFEKDGLGCVAGLGERRQVLGQDGRVEGKAGRGMEKARNAREAKCRRVAYLVQRLIVDARTEHRDGRGSTLRLQRERASLWQRCPISARDEIRLVNEEKHGRLGANTSAARRGNRGSMRRPWPRRGR
jgi:hypothetical protein